MQVASGIDSQAKKEDNHFPLLPPDTHTVEICGNVWRHFQLLQMSKAKGTSEVETRDANKHLKYTEESLTRKKKKKPFKLKPNNTVGIGVRRPKCPLHQFSSVAQLFVTLCDHMDSSTPGFSINKQLPELAQTHVH